MTGLQTLTLDAYEAWLALHQSVLTGGVTVYDGPQPVIPTDPEFVVVGSDDPTIDGFVLTVDQGAQAWESLGADARLETFTLHATYVAWVGDNNFPALRSQAKTRIRALGVALSPPPRGTGDAMLNNVLNQGGVGWCGLTVNRIRTKADRDGFALHMHYSLDCTARI